MGMGYTACKVAEGDTRGRILVSTPQRQKGQGGVRVGTTMRMGNMSEEEEGDGMGTARMAIHRGLMLMLMRTAMGFRMSMDMDNTTATNLTATMPIGCA